MSSKTLVFLLHGFNKTPERLSALKAATEAALPGATVEVPPLPLGYTSYKDPCDIVADLLEKVDKCWGTNSFDRIILVGHSVGSLLARKVYIAACGASARAPLEPQLSRMCAKPRDWAGAVERIVLIAGLNNGWSINHHMSLGRAFAFGFGEFASRVLFVIRRRWPVILAMKRGASFLTQLRLQWLAMRGLRVKGGRGDAIVVQLLGTIDDLVSPNDNIDLVTGQDFYFLDVPKSGHATVLDMDSSPEGLARAAVYRQALMLPQSTLRSESAPLVDVSPVSPDYDVQEVVFVIHGIRDEGYWTDRIARAIVHAARDRGRKFARITSTYGFFGMFPFLRSWKRREKVEWLMDQYADAIARYPNATKFHYVGHSNGTYLLARALTEYPCCQFNRVVFAGSVVRSTFDWSALMKNSKPPQVEEVLNFAATGDWVVAGFPNAFERLGIPDLGGAGHWGFKPDRTSGNAQVTNIRYVVGGHSAALGENNWAEIAEFVVQGRVPATLRVPCMLAHPWWSRLLGFFPYAAWLFIVCVLSIVPVVLLTGLFCWHWPQWIVTAALIGYGSSVWYVGNRL